VAKLTVYIHSFEVGTVGFVDKEGAQHACAQAQSTAFQSLARLSGLFGSNYLCDEDRETLIQVEEFCKNSHIKYAVVDMGKLPFIARLRLRMKGIKTPTICYGSEKLQGVPCNKDLERLVSKRGN
jgi:hypothetical protein